MKDNEIKTINKRSIIDEQKLLTARGVLRKRRILKEISLSSRLLQTNDFQHKSILLKVICLNIEILIVIVLFSVVLE